MNGLDRFRDGLCGLRHAKYNAVRLARKRENQQQTHRDSSIPSRPWRRLTMDRDGQSVGAHHRMSARS